MPLKALLASLFLLIAGGVLFAQTDYDYDYDYEEEPYKPPREDIWLGFSGDFALYSVNGNAFGGGVQAGFGSSTSLGIKLSWFFSPEDIDTIELNLLFRFYLAAFLRRPNVNSGPFIQLYSGPSIYFRNGHFNIPFGRGMFSIGGGLGWRIIIFKNVYIEPYIRGGYPYQLGAGLSLGFRF